ncbi:hypothetical protein ABMY20_05580 [Tenacibaculum sp. SSH1-16]|uniref:hypothetical protein n=1 Tax=unclassified Tenacibaculum TaxID=2635139 RepID=UPI0012E48659|nr:hypothetical protein [Tenacibaculum sp. XPcli2-G]MCO7185697.1 hypothetical protein [Tenacibaculum sp. XPcli2-G]GFD76567.1 hypothetical protein KUL113_59870 [Tenacibaculum sp. KUL113]
MKNSNIFLLLLFIITFFSSCFKGDEPITCVEANEVSLDYFQLESKIHTSKKSEFKLSNVCDVDTRITEILLKGDNPKDFRIEGLSIGTSISRKGTYFNLVFTPTKVGTRKTIVIIRHDTGELVMYLSGKGI